MKCKIDNYLLASTNINDKPDNSEMIQLTPTGKGTNILCSHCSSKSRSFINFGHYKEALK